MTTTTPHPASAASPRPSREARPASPARRLAAILTSSPAPSSASAFPYPARAEGLHSSQTHRALAQRGLSSRARFLQLLFLAALGLLLAAACSGCSASNGTAATVNGVAISEQAVTDYVQSLRAAQGLEGSAEWRAYLDDSAQTSEDIRDQVVDLLISREILRQGAADLGVRVNSEEVDEAVNAKRRTYESDEQWKQALAAAGLDEQTYRKEVELDLLSGKVTQALIDNPELAAEATQDTEDSAYDEVGDAASASGVTPDEATVESARAQAALTWLANLRAQADITVNPMPGGLPY